MAQMLSAGAYVAGKAVGPNSKAVRCCIAQQQRPDLSLLLPRLRQECDFGKNQHIDSVRSSHVTTKCVPGFVLRGQLMSLIAGMHR